MKRATLVMAVLVVFVGNASADVTYNNFTGYSAYWSPFGNPDTATYGETFTAPSTGGNVLQNFSFYMAGPYSSGDIELGAYIATWTGTNAGTLVYSSAELDYSNTGDAQLSFTTGGVSLSPGENYVAFLSVSQYYGQSAGLAYISAGAATIPGGNFVYSNNSGDFSALFNSSWATTGIKPDWAFTADFSPTAVPEPSTVAIALSGAVAFIAYGLLRRRTEHRRRTAA
jgi:hypothetical protein